MALEATSAPSSSSYRLVASVASEAMGIGKSSDVLTVLGGKASCRRKFVLNVHLLDENGNLATSKDLSIVASVAYAHDHSPVVRDDKPFLAEPPLFTTFNGVEFPAQERPTRMVAARASFKLAISLLSSKCDNRLFCICFTPQPSSICHPCYSKPIRSISRKRTQSTPLTIPVPPIDSTAAAAALNSPSTTDGLKSTDSGSPNSGTLTSSDSCCIENKDQCGQSCCVTTPTTPAPAPSTRPFRPYASVGACKLPLGADFHLGLVTPAQSPHPQQQPQQSPHAAPHQPQQSPHAAVPKVMNEVSLEEEEKSLQYIEVSLQEVNRELQRRKEELRSKRRRLLEDEARMHTTIFHQSSSWIESLSGRFSL